MKTKIRSRIMIIIIFLLIITISISSSSISLPPITTNIKNVIFESGTYGIKFANGNITNASISTQTNITLPMIFSFKEFIKHPFTDIFSNKWGVNMTFVLALLMFIPLFTLFLFIKKRKRKKGIIVAVKKDKKLKQKMIERNKNYIKLTIK